MDSSIIYKKANDLVMSCGSRNPERIASDMGIVIFKHDGFTNLLGLYTYHWNTRMIILNDKLTSPLLDMVLAHEIGHDQLHRALAKKGNKLQEFSLFMEKDITEYEANAFASHILLSNDDIYSLALQGYDAMTIAKITNTDINLLLIKLQEMISLGYKFNIPFRGDPKFFKNIRCDE